MSHVKRFRCFIEVADRLHFRKAAEHLNLTQPALSTQIKELEKEVGTKLFDRDRRSVKLTQAGETLLSRAREAVRLIDEAIDEIELQVAEAGNKLRLGYVEYLNLPFVPGALANLRKHNPDIEVSILEMHSDAVINALIERKIDIGVAFLPVTHNDLASRPMITGQWMLVLPREHVLAREAEIRMEALSGVPLILFAEQLNPPLYAHVNCAMEGAGVKPDIVHHVSQAHAGPKYVSDGLGCFLHASYVLDDLPSDLVRLPVKGLSPLEMGLVWRGDHRTPAIKAFLKAAKSEETD